MGSYIEQKRSENEFLNRLGKSARVVEIIRNMAIKATTGKVHRTPESCGNFELFENYDPFRVVSLDNRNPKLSRNLSLTFSSTNYAYIIII